MFYVTYHNPDKHLNNYKILTKHNLVTADICQTFITQMFTKTRQINIKHEFTTLTNEKCLNIDRKNASGLVFSNIPWDF